MSAKVGKAGLQASLFQPHHLPRKAHPGFGRHAPWPDRSLECALQLCIHLPGTDQEGLGRGEESTSLSPVVSPCSGGHTLSGAEPSPQAQGPASGPSHLDLREVFYRMSL